ncbi:hypothetical protein D1872_52160 [compost metagenome]
MSTNTAIRTPFSIKRKAITSMSEAGHTKSGGWMVFDRPNEEPPNWKLEKGERILWCPWCGAWAIYKKVHGDDAWRCQSYCGWANTNDYYVRQANKIWFEEVPLGELKKLDIPRPGVRRGR